MKKVIAFPHKPGSGGPGSFQRRFEAQLIKEGFNIGYLSNKKLNPDVIFIVGGTKKIFSLIKWKNKGVPIVYRLDGINWLHKVRKAKQNTFKNFFRSELINLNNKIIHGYLADFIVYQSEFVKKWWNIKGFKKRNDYAIINNGVDLKKFKPASENPFFQKLVILEGLIDYSPYAIELINELNEEFREELEIYGGIHYQSEKEKLNKDVNYKGTVEFDKIQNVYSNSIYISLDVNPACPNTVAEALACGAPVVGFDTGSLKELLTPKSGICVNYGSNPWNLEYPDSKNLMKAIKKIRLKYKDYSISAREHALRNYSIEHMTSKYIQILKNIING